MARDDIEEQRPSARDDIEEQCPSARDDILKSSARRRAMILKSSAHRRAMIFEAIGDSQLCCLRCDDISDEDSTMCLLDGGNR